MQMIRNSVSRHLRHLGMAAVLLTLVCLTAGCADDKQQNLADAKTPAVAMANNGQPNIPAPVPAYSAAPTYRAAPYYYAPTMSMIPTPH